MKTYIEILIHGISTLYIITSFTGSLKVSIPDFGYLFSHYHEYCTFLCVIKKKPLIYQVKKLSNMDFIFR